MKLKYIVYDNGMFDDIIIFPEFHDHHKMAQRLQIAPEAIISAGFIRRGDREPYCFGESLSLGVASREEDTQLLGRFLK